MIDMNRMIRRATWCASVAVLSLVAVPALVLAGFTAVLALVLGNPSFQATTAPSADELTRGAWAAGPLPPRDHDVGDDHDSSNTERDDFVRMR